MRWLEIFAFALLTFDLTGSAFAVVLVGLVRLIPLGFGAFVGLIAHRFRERSVIAVSIALGVAAHGALFGLALADRVAVWHMAAVAFTSGVVLAVDFTVRRPLLGALVAPEFGGRAVSLDLVANNATRILGPAATGALIDGLGYPAVFLTGMIVYGIALLTTLLVDLESVSVDGGSSGWSEMTEAYRFARRSPGIMADIGMTVVMNLFVFPYRHLVPVIGQEVLGLNATRIGLLTATEGVGMTIGAVALAFRLRVSQYRGFLIWGTAATATAAIVFGVSSWLPLSMAALFVAGFALSCFSTTQVAIVVAEAGPELRSRVMGLIGTFIGLNPVGLLILGGLATAFGPAGGVIALGALGVAGTGVGARFATRRSDA
jgi:MFS family permease